MRGAILLVPCSGLDEVMAAHQEYSVPLLPTMKVERTNEGALTDYEVLQLMRERKETRLHKSAMVAYAERNWIDHKVIKFLTQSHSKCSFLDDNKVQEFISRLNSARFQLTPAEKLQFINHCPTELVDIHLIVEDCADRFTEAQIEELMVIVEDTLASGLPKDTENDGAEGTADQMKMDS